MPAKDGKPSLWEQMGRKTGDTSTINIPSIDLRIKGKTAAEVATEEVEKLKKKSGK